MGTLSNRMTLTTFLFVYGSPHLLAPTASNLENYGAIDTVLAGFHTDLNFLQVVPLLIIIDFNLPIRTIHGRSRFPGLNIWARNTGKRIPVQFPSSGRFLLVQAGKQLEHLTGGVIRAGYHEVVVNAATLKVEFLKQRDLLCLLTFLLKASEARKISHPSRPAIRISSTFFWHLSSDYTLQPISSIRSASGTADGEDRPDVVTPASERYPAMKVGEQVSM